MKQGLADALKSANVQANIGGTTPPPADGKNAGGGTGDLAPALAKQASDFLDQHHFRATKSEDVADEKRCDVWLDDHIVKQDDVRAALTKAIPALADDPIGLAHFVSARWDDEIHQALVQSGNWPGVPKPPDGVLRRKRDGHIYWAPNSAVATIANAAPPAPDDWVLGFLDFYDLEAAADDSRGAQGCVFNSDATTIDGVVATLAAQAPLAGYAASANAKTLAAKRVADQKADNSARDLVDRIAATIKAKGDLRGYVGMLSQMDVRTLLATVMKLKQAGLLDAFLGNVDNSGMSDRVGAAILTVQGDFGPAWKAKVRTLRDDDRKAILERAPSGISLDDDLKPDENAKARVQISVQFGPVIDLAKKGPPGTKPDKVGGQATYQVTLSLHPENKHGLDLSWQFQVTGFPDHDDPKWRVQQILSGPQGFYNFLDGSLQVGLFGQALAGQAHDPVKMRFTPTGQLAGGGQIQYQFADGHLLIGGQLAGVFTDQNGSPTGDLQGQLTLGFQF